MASVSAGGGTTRGLAIGSSAASSGGASQREAVRPVALQPLQSAGRGGRGGYEGAYAEAARSAQAMTSGPAKSSIFAAQLRDVDGSPLGLAGGFAGGPGGRVGAAGAPNNNVNYKPYLPWWWDFEKMKVQKRWELWNYNWQKAASETLIALSKGVGCCILMGKADCSMGSVFGTGNRGKSEFYCLKADGSHAAYSLEKYRESGCKNISTSTTSKKEGDEETEDVSYDSDCEDKYRIAAGCAPKSKMIRKAGGGDTWWDVRRDCFGFGGGTKSDASEVATSDQCHAFSKTPKLEDVEFEFTDSEFAKKKTNEDRTNRLKKYGYYVVADCSEKITTKQDNQTDKSGKTEKGKDTFKGGTPLEQNLVDALPKVIYLAYGHKFEGKKVAKVADDRKCTVTKVVGFITGHDGLDEKEIEVDGETGKRLADAAGVTPHIQAVTPWENIHSGEDAYSQAKILGEIKGKRELFDIGPAELAKMSESRLRDNLDIKSKSTVECTRNDKNLKYWDKTVYGIDSDPADGKADGGQSLLKMKGKNNAEEAFLSCGPEHGVANLNNAPDIDSVFTATITNPGKCVYAILFQRPIEQNKTVEYWKAIRTASPRKGTKDVACGKDALPALPDTACKYTVRFPVGVPAGGTTPDYGEGKVVWVTTDETDKCNPELARMKEDTSPNPLAGNGHTPAWWYAILSDDRPGSYKDEICSFQFGCTLAGNTCSQKKTVMFKWNDGEEILTQSVDATLTTGTGSSTQADVQVAQYIEKYKDDLDTDEMQKKPGWYTDKECTKAAENFPLKDDTSVFYAYRAFKGLLVTLKVEGGNAECSANLKIGSDTAQNALEKDVRSNDQGATRNGQIKQGDNVFVAIAECAGYKPIVTSSTGGISDDKWANNIRTNTTITVRFIEEDKVLQEGYVLFHKDSHELRADDTNIRVINESTASIKFDITSSDNVVKPYRRAYCCDNGDGKYSLKVFNEDGSDYKTFDNVDVQEACGGISEQCFTKCDITPITDTFDDCQATFGDSNKVLAKVYNTMERCINATSGPVNVRVEGHTSKAGLVEDKNGTKTKIRFSNTINVNLSDARAITVANMVKMVLLEGDKNGRPALLREANIVYEFNPLGDRLTADEWCAIEPDLKKKDGVCAKPDPKENQWRDCDNITASKNTAEIINTSGSGKGRQINVFVRGYASLHTKQTAEASRRIVLCGSVAGKAPDERQCID
jgi:hypothetical protein